MKDEVVNFCLEHGLEVKKNTAKAVLVDLIIDHGLLEDLFDTFSYRFTMPIWKVADCFGLYQSELEALVKKKRELLLPLFRSSFKPFDDLPQITLHVYYIVPHEKREAVGGFSFQKLMLGATF